MKFLTFSKYSLRLILFFTVLWLALGAIDYYLNFNKNGDKSTYKITTKTIERLKNENMPDTFIDSLIISLNDSVFLNQYTFSEKLDQQFSNSRIAAYKEKVITYSKFRINWFEDVIGHWLIGFLIILNIIIVLANKVINNNLIIDNPDKIVLNARAKRIKKGIMFSFVISITLAISNSMYVAYYAKYVEHWQNSIHHPSIAFLTGFGFYLLCLFPFFTSTFFYSEKLYYFSKRPKQFKSFGYKNIDYAFGLSDIGNSLVWYSIFAILGCFPTIFFQQAKYDFTVAFFAAPILLGTAIYFIAIKPLWHMYDYLNSEKHRIYAEVMNGKNQLEEKLKKTNNIDEVNVINTKIKLKNEDLVFISKLQRLPLSFPAKIAGFIGAVLTICMTLINVLKGFGFF